MLKNKWAKFSLLFAWALVFVGAEEFTKWLYETGRFGASKWYLTGVVLFWYFFGCLSVVLEPYMVRTKNKKSKKIK